MTNKKFILNADDFGMNKAYNKAILEGYGYGLLKSASLMANGEAFEEACWRVIPACPDLGIGIHLNITEGKSLCDGLDILTNNQGEFDNSYYDLLIQSMNKKDVEFMEQIEKEFRAQIKKIISRVEVTHIDSHSHIHSIPRIFELVCKLAKEYGIKQVRTHFEKPYLIPDVYKHLNRRYFANLIKIVVWDIFSAFNESCVYKYGLCTNDNLIGVGYSSMMDSLTISYGLMAINYDKVVVEGIIHPCRYENGTIDNHFEEFLITKNLKLKTKIENLEFEITNYREIHNA